MSSVPEFFDSEDGAFDYVYTSGSYEETISDVWNNCVKLSTLSIFFNLYKVILVNFVFSIVVSTGWISESVFHILSGICGLFLITTLQSVKGKIVIILFLIQSFFLLKLGCLIQSRYKTFQKNKINKIQYFNCNIVKYVLITSLVLCEYFLLEAETWMEIRGVIMIFSMKLISLAEDIDRGIINFPTFVRYFGYVFCGANIMFGPWISFNEYVILFYQRPRKNIWWIFGILRAVTISIIFLTISNCWTSYLVSNNSNRWLVGYRDALSFRASHYFICYLSEASMLATGYKSYKLWHDHKQWRYIITDPLEIELPNSLTTVVTHWNRPMHDFLKRYVYKSWLPLGKFYGVLATFIASSFLHGFELKISIVLITIGVFSYIQFAMRNNMAQIFNSCIKVYPCKANCKHKYKRNHIRSRIYMAIFSMLTVVHLIFLGVLMDSSTSEVSIYDKWNRLFFASFWIMLIHTLTMM